ncbi:MAG: hypothetical protein JSS20_04670 [Proteobacteria bacterium]|nr:hypothetical protein [Pseudomonadota bacterium]
MLGQPAIGGAPSSGIGGSGAGGGATAPGGQAATGAAGGQAPFPFSTTPVQPIQPAPNSVSSQSGGATGNQLYGGGGATVKDCMQLWDKSSHMTRTEWRATCKRTLNGINLPIPKL